MDVPVVSGPTVGAGASDGSGMVSRPVQKSCAHECVASKAAFICKVISRTWVVESRNYRLKVVVETTKEILGVTDVNVEMVVNMLNNPKRGVFQHDILYHARNHS